ncbi:hypothetical protein PJL18_04328 [Paenarthrobacter nicotinovorans]|nr:hypothetical protein [Paenarthrobacter nicotinovorans]
MHEDEGDGVVGSGEVRTDREQPHPVNHNEAEAKER